MPQTTQPPLTLTQAARLTLDVFGREETEKALATVYGLTPEQVTGVMQRLNAAQN